MLKNVQTFNLEFRMQQTKDDKFIVPFKIVIQSSNLQIEKYCAKTWPDLMHSALLSMDQLYRLQKMKNYIKRSLSTQTKDDILKYFFDKRWVDPIKNMDKIVKIDFTDFNCKMWSLADPYLEIEGNFYIDLEKMLNLYIDKYIDLDVQDKLLSEKVKIKFKKPWPVLLNYRGSIQYKQIILNKLKNKIEKSGSNNFKKKLEKALGFKDLHKIKKNLNWQNESLILEITDIMKLLKLKAPKAILPLAGGFITRRSLK